MANPYAFTSNVGQLFATPAADLRNGAPTNVTPIFIGAGMAKPYHVIMTNALMTTGDATPPDCEIEIIRLTLLHMAQMTAIIPDAAKRFKTALALASGRLAVERMFGLVAGDYIPTQVSDIGGTWGTESDIGVFRPTSGAVTGAAVTAEEVNLHPMADDIGGVTVETYIGLVARISVGMPVVQGVVLFKTLAHHFVDPYKAYARAVVKEVLGRNQKATAGLTQEEFEDVVCHKVAHPIRSDIMTGLATSEDTVARFRAFGLASAVVRVPAKTDIESLISSFVKLVDAVASQAAEANLSLGTGPADIRKLATDCTAEAKLATTTAQRIAIEQKYRDILATYEPHLAFCIGFYKEMLGDATGDTLLKAKGLERLANENPTGVAKGASAYERAKTWEMDRVRAGALVGAAVFNGVAPTPRAAPAREGPMGMFATVLEGAISSYLGTGAGTAAMTTQQPFPAPGAP